MSLVGVVDGSPAGSSMGFLVGFGPILWGKKPSKDGGFVVGITVPSIPPLSLQPHEEVATVSVQMTVTLEALQNAWGSLPPTWVPVKVKSSSVMIKFPNSVGIVPMKESCHGETNGSS